MSEKSIMVDHGFLQENFIKTFGQIEKINGTLGVDGKMHDFGNLTEVGGDLWFSNHVYQENLESIKPLKMVYGDLNLKNTHASLESLEEVGGNLNLRKTTCHNISSLTKSWWQCLGIQKSIWTTLTFH